MLPFFNYHQNLTWQIYLLQLIKQSKSLFIFLLSLTSFKLMYFDTISHHRVVSTAFLCVGVFEVCYLYFVTFCIWFWFIWISNCSHHISNVKIMQQMSKCLINFNYKILFSCIITSALLQLATIALIIFWSFFFHVHICLSLWPQLLLYLHFHPLVNRVVTLDSILYNTIPYTFHNEYHLRKD